MPPKLRQDFFTEAHIGHGAKITLTWPPQPKFSYVVDKANPIKLDVIPLRTLLDQASADCLLI